MHHLCEAAAADELKELRWQATDRDCAREVSKSSQFLYSIDPTGGIVDKLSLLIQMELAQIDYPSTVTSFDSQRLRGETNRALEVMNRLIRAVIECKASQQDGDGCSAALSLARSLSTKAWEHGPAHLTQVPQVGKALMRKFVGSNIRTVLQLADTPASTIERIASRNPPFGKKMTDALAWFPRLTLRIEAKATRSIRGTKSLDVDAILGFLNAVGTPKWGNKIPVVTVLAHTSNGVCVFFWRNSLRVFKRGRSTHTLSFSWAPETIGEQLVCQFACEEIAGTLVMRTLAHNLTFNKCPSLARPAKGHSQSAKSQCVSSFLSLDEDLDDDDLLVAVQDVPSNGHREAQMAATEAGVYTIRNDRALQVARPGTVRNPGTQKSYLSEKTDSEQEPVRLENSNFKCGHPCSWSTSGRTARGVKCGHQCCREGSKHPPKSNKRSVKRTAESDGLSEPEFTGSIMPAKRARTAEPASRPNAPTSTGQYTLDDDGFIDLTQGDDFLGTPEAAQKQTLSHRDNQLHGDTDVDPDNLDKLQWSLETRSACSGQPLSNEALQTLVGDEDSCWAEFFALSPLKTGPDVVGGSVTDARMTEDVESASQSLPFKCDPAVEENSRTAATHCAPSNQRQDQALDDPDLDAIMVAVTTETSKDGDEDPMKRQKSEPDWVSEIDSGLIDELRGFVDFL